MPSPPGTDPQRRRLLREAVDQFAADLATAESGQRVPGLEWTVGELGAHLVVLPRLYREMADQPEPMPIPADGHRFSADRIRAVETRRSEDLAALTRREVMDLLDYYGDDPDARFNHWAVEQPLAVIESTLLDEFLIHGRDLGAAKGNIRPISRTQAITALDGVLPVAANFVDPEAAGDLTATVHLHMRGDREVEAVDWTQTIAQGAMTVTRTRPRRPDVRIHADPVAFLLLSLGRIGRIRPTLTGKVVAYGRKPWLAARLPNIFLDV
ncbi:MAG: maleylpyruvate isomerase N-terminal domain-containing protein [Acidimicrobiia bacterium]|nr:maleylpyruvate isomerase N-terminal domain-containing protein [Acidimicrobiia bacterium]